MTLCFVNPLVKKQQRQERAQLQVSDSLTQLPAASTPHPHSPDCSPPAPACGATPPRTLGRYRSAGASRYRASPLPARPPTSPCDYRFRRRPQAAGPPLNGMGRPENRRGRRAESQAGIGLRGRWFHGDYRRLSSAVPLFISILGRGGDDKRVAGSMPCPSPHGGLAAASPIRRSLLLGHFA